MTRKVHTTCGIENLNQQTSAGWALKETHNEDQRIETKRTGRKDQYGNNLYGNDDIEYGVLNKLVFVLERDGDEYDAIQELERELYVIRSKLNEALDDSKLKALIKERDEAIATREQMRGETASANDQLITQAARARERFAQDEKRIKELEAENAALKIKIEAITSFFDPAQRVAISDGILEKTTVSEPTKDDAD